MLIEIVTVILGLVVGFGIGVMWTKARTNRRNVDLIEESFNVIFSDLAADDEADMQAMDELVARVTKLIEGEIDDVRGVVMEATLTERPDWFAEGEINGLVIAREFVLAAAKKIYEEAESDE